MSGSDCIDSVSHTGSVEGDALFTDGFIIGVFVGAALCNVLGRRYTVRKLPWHEYVNAR